MNSAELFETRVRKYQKKSMKYIRYMLNDHFLIVLFFLFGFIMVQYSSWIQTIRVLEWPLLGLLAVLLASVPFFGGVATLLEPADGIFLSVVGQDFKAYLQKAIRRSWGASVTCDAGFNRNCLSNRSASLWNEYEYVHKAILLTSAL